MDTRLANALSGRYDIGRELGAGGMATVWLAHDVKHDRQVAIKVLHPQLAAVLGAERFLKEIRTTAQLQHPHILPLFDSGESDGLLYYVMPFVDEESLRERLTRETRLPVDDAVRIGAEVASALDYAHRHGVIHRDIKPENILLHEGRALVADFGIALAPGAGGGERMTETGISLGTPSYMSPEQALGERTLDARSDIYAAGALVYEMLIGTPPFTGDSVQAIVAKVITGTPVAPSKVRREIPTYVSEAVLTALQKKPTDRFATGAALQAALQGSARPATVKRTIAAHRRLIVTAIAAVVIALVTYSARRFWKVSDTPLSLSIAALPFQIEDTSDAYLGDQVPAEILDALTHVSGLIVRPLAAAPRFRMNRDLSAVAGQLQVGTLLTGSIARQKNSIRVTVRLYDARRDLNLPTVSFTDRSENKFGLEDSISKAIVANFNLKQSDAQLASTRVGRTTSAAAHDTLMLAHFYAERRTPRALGQAVVLSRAAIRLDSTYAEAWAGLASALSLSAGFGDSAPSSYYPEATASVLRALQLDNTSADAHTTYGFLKVFSERDYRGARSEFAKAISLDSMQSSAWLFQAWAYLGLNEMDSALASLRHGWRIDPASLIIGSRLGLILAYADSLPAAEQQLRNVLALENDFRQAQLDLAMVYAYDNRCADALAALPVDPSPWNAGHPAHAEPAYVRARCNQRSKARQWLDSIETGSRAGMYVNPVYAAAVYAAFDDRADVYRWLTKAVDMEDWSLFMLPTFPAFKPYREDPEFRQLLKRARLL